MRNFERRMKSISMFGISVMLLASSSTLSADDDDDREFKRCSNSSLKGSYAFFQNGEIDGRGAVADVGVFTADGRGNITGSETVHLIDGSVFEIAFCNGTYDIAESCTGTFVWDAVVGGPCETGINIGERTHTVTLGRKEVYILSTTPGTVLVGLGTKR